MTRISLYAIVLAVAVTVSAQTSSVANPFAGIPSLADLTVCNAECRPVAQLQSSWNGDYSSACTTTFAASLSKCIACVANSSIGVVILTPSNQQQLAQALQSYQTSCQQAGSPVTLNISSILAPTATATGIATGTPTMTRSQTATTTPNAATKVTFGAGAVLGALALVAGNLL